MIVQFLTIPPFTDVSVLKDRAKKRVKADSVKQAHALCDIAQEIAGCSWDTLLHDHTATVAKDGRCYLSVDGFPVAIESLYTDSKQRPLAAGKEISLRSEVEPACAPRSGRGLGKATVRPGVLITYHSEDGNDRPVFPTTVAIPNPALINGKVPQTGREKASSKIPLRERYGPACEAIIGWVREQLSKPIPDPASLPLEERRQMVETENERRTFEPQAEFDEKLLSSLEEHATPMQKAQMARLWYLQAPGMPAIYHLASQEPNLPAAERLRLAHGAAEAARMWLDANGPIDPTYWGMLETREFMRYSRWYADVAVEVGEIDTAIKALERLMVLNPNDNQGNRYALIGLYLQRGRPEDLQAAERILEDPQYGSGIDSVMVHLSAILAHMREGDTEVSRNARSRSQIRNESFAPVIASSKNFPPVESFSHGSLDEAIFCLSLVKGALDANPRTRAWMIEHVT